MGRRVRDRPRRRAALKLRALRAGVLLACVALLPVCSTSQHRAGPAGHSRPRAASAVAPPVGVRDWNVSIVPRPRLLVAAPGAYVWQDAARISASTPDERTVAVLLQRYLRAHGLHAAIVRDTRVPVDAALRIVANGDRALGREGYRLSVSGRGVRLVANARAGLFYGLQTFEQASKFLPGRRLVTRNVSITDWPSYGWRGIQLDVSRHFFGPRVIERYIDVAAHYKLNTFHWHLTDDRAWRLQSERYPLLTTAQGCASGACEFYTQAEIRRIVAYAALRSVRIVPEIDVPGHSGAALAAYPALACTHDPRPHVLCPTDATLAFVKNVLAEVLKLFPGRYVHVGGDEVDTSEWYGSREVAAVMRREHLPTLAAVQPYFTKRLAHFLRLHGRRLVGWDEIADGAPADATVMVWRPHSAAVPIIRSGHDVVLTPNGALYFDAYQGSPSQEPSAFGGVTTLKDVYAYDALPSGLDWAQRTHVLGAQANLWTERIATPRHLFYMLLPRELALAEITWSRPQSRNWNSFVRRLPQQFAWLSAQRYAFRVPNPLCTSRRAARSGGFSAEVVLTAPLDANIRYTLDGSAPTATSRLYRTPLHVSGGLVRARVFVRDGQRSSVSECSARAPPTQRQSRPAI